MNTKPLDTSQLDTKQSHRRSIGSGTPWEDLAGYTRAIRVGDRILVSGTTALGPNGPVGTGDPALQTRFILDKIEVAIRQLGGTMHDVIRTRIYVSSIAHWEAVALVHGERFGEIRPVTTLVQAQLIAPEYLVEIEAEAVVGSG
jgi:enamine deaminase RidA (YjgF/YER057c/UK114 family)